MEGLDIESQKCLRSVQVHTHQMPRSTSLGQLFNFFFHMSGSTFVFSVTCVTNQFKDCVVLKLKQITVKDHIN